MKKEIIETSKSPLIEVQECKGDLVIRPWMELAVQAAGDFQHEKTDAGLLFRANSDLYLHAPEGSSLRIESAAGDLVVKNIRSEIVINECKGDVILNNTQSAKIANVRGDLLVNNLSGALSAETLGGDVVIRNIDGQVSFEHVNGDIAANFINGSVILNQVNGDINLRTVNGDFELAEGHRDVNLRNLGGLCNLTMVHGDIRLAGGLAAGNHQFTAEGDIVVRWPDGAPINLAASAPEITDELQLQDVRRLDDQLFGHLGDGETTVNLKSGGKILLKKAQIFDDKWQTGSQEVFDMDFLADLADIGERVSAEVNQHMMRMSEYMETRFGPEFAQSISEKASKHAEHVGRQAEKAADKMRKYAERESARAERKYRRASSAKASSPSSAPEHAGEKVSPAEQLKILKMVEQGTITPDEAQILLDALEG